MSPYRSRRVAVTSPQTRLAHAQRRQDRPWRRPQLSAAETERATLAYRRQLRRAVAALGLVFALLFGLPAVFGLFPVLDTWRLGGIAVSWLLLGVLPYPVLLALAWWQLRRAEAAEEPEQ